MHELGLAESILDIVREHVPLDRAAAVRRVRVRVGEVAGVISESLTFCFGAIVAGTPYVDASIEIERAPGRELRVAEVELADEEAQAPGAPTP
jgi:hydrogenase nickel incorporation protein HypA/HybF